MDNFRPLLYISLLFVLFVIWQDWQHAHQPKPPVATATQGGGGMTADKGTGVPSVTRGAPPAAASVQGAGQGERIHIRTDVLDLTLSTRGGDILEARLPTYPVSVNKPNDPFTLMFDRDGTFVAQSGLVSADAKRAPDHYALYRTTQTSYDMKQGENTLRVPLTWTGPEGVKVTKTYIFHRGSFLVDVDYRIENAGTKPWKGMLYSQLVHGPLESHSSFLQAHSYQGAAYYDGSYQKVPFDDMAKSPLSKTVKGGWMAMVQHYFLVAWIPAKDQDYDYYSKAVTGGNQPLYLIGYRTGAVDVAPGGDTRVGSRMWIGPELQEKLEKVAPGLDLTTGYGIFTVIAKPLFWLLSRIHGFVGNWGFAIILLTLMIKLAFYKLSATSYRSMARMRSLQPKMQALKERYGDDRQKLSQATMELYRTEKINPLGGCLPIVVQIPVFIALYWVLLESVELRQAPFIFWIHDLSTKDPYFVLPVIMGITMFLQQRLNPAPMDPLQKRIMTIMPLGFAVFMAFFPAGLVLYWVVNNTLSIAQQWLITKRMEKDSGK
ncbi:membrane protein insertase YidC [Acidihalobacter prosperus]|uniref:Membrane protein insertase YidC n=1 Tax=Acidihalobacter prosperus TaxID=160660 RepID=A0A1A6C4U7_9GAMM|nr:membrane protein insertase YidC [Acidihalobacter prosperus]OBS09570.1 membrane protein insertase YidC [Acidihalobacter prosperus]